MSYADPAPRTRPAGSSSSDSQDVLDVVVRLPKTMNPHATVADARAAFTDDHVQMLLLTEDGLLVGTLLVGDLPPLGRGDEPASDYASLQGRTLPPELPAEDARRLLLTCGQRRRAVVDGSGRLLGLLCLKRHLTGFCSDDDVAARTP